jgi:hypothetical protein
MKKDIVWFINSPIHRKIPLLHMYCISLPLYKKVDKELDAIIHACHTS